jgi:hypothetical protein
VKLSVEAAVATGGAEFPTVEYAAMAPKKGHWECGDEGVEDNIRAETRSEKCVRGEGVSTVAPGRKEASGGSPGAAADARRSSRYGGGNEDRHDRSIYPPRGRRKQKWGVRRLSLVALASSGRSTD